MEALTSSSYSGFSKVVSNSVRLEVEPGYQITDPAALVEHLLKVDWSINGARPTTGSTLSFGKPISFDPVETAKNLGWETANGGQNSRSSLVSVELEELEHRLGPWPGKIPVLPDGAISKTAEGSANP